MTPDMAEDCSHEGGFCDSACDGRNKVTVMVPNSDELAKVEEATHYSTATKQSSAGDNEPASLEGILLFRRGRSSFSSLWWQRRYVVLNLLDGGSISCFSFIVDNQKHQEPAFVQKKNLSMLHRRLSLFGEDSDVLSLHIPANVPWHVKDVENDASSFVIEIETEKYQEGTTIPVEEETRGFNGLDYLSAESADDHSDSDDLLAAEYNEEEREEEYEMDVEGSLYRDIMRAQIKGKPLRFYFKCPRGGHEKSLWLKAFSSLDRLSSLFRRQKSLLGQLKSPVRLTHSRTRSDASTAFAIEGSKLEQDENRSNDVNIHIWNHDTSGRGRNGREKEHRVIPEYCYPNRWMTQTELQEEMLRESEYFHDLRHPSCDTPEVGQIQVEILAALGLPKLDRLSDSDACVYVVCGPYAFNTDVIKNKNNPMFLAKTQRACTIPLHHAYARVYIGVFDDEKNTKDDFNGRVVLDIARLRPDCTYDVTLPLRLSKHVYTRRQRGAIRIRVKLQWTNMRAALLSYLPRRIRIPRNLSEFSPNTDTTVLTGDSRAFRNVAITVHGSHLPGHFRYANSVSCYISCVPFSSPALLTCIILSDCSFQQLRSTLREINFTRKSMMTLFKKNIRGMREWENPFMSAFVFFAWMHAVYANNFSLVPAYVVSYFMLHLIRNYAIYGIDGPEQRGFIPPSWEELFFGLIRHPESSSRSSIQPLNMGYHKQTEDSEVLKYKIETHEPLGKGLFRLVGFLDDKNDHPIAFEDAHLEFPFGSGVVYPKFSVKDSLVSRRARISSSISPTASTKGQPKRRSTFINELSKKLEMEMPGRLRKDSSGMNDYDDEEQRFATGKFIRKTGATQLKGAANGLKDVGESLTEATGLHYVVSPFMSPIRGGLHYVAKAGYQQVLPPIKSGIKTGRNLVVSPLHQTVHYMRRGSNEYASVPINISPVTSPGDRVVVDPSDHGDANSSTIHGDDQSTKATSVSSDDNGIISHGHSELDSKDLIPDQDIDFTSANSGKEKGNRKRLTDDLNETKDKMHEMTFHLFNDQTYVVRDPDSCYFGHAGRSSKRRKVDVSRHLNKLLQVGQYSHSNPVVARVGQYVEPMIGASHSFLCLFRALFNIMTWRDPFLTFWVSLFGFLLVVILFIFPWRLFFFVVGLWFIGPQVSKKFLKLEITRRQILC